MFTPQQIDQISFSRATFGGYDMQAVDQFLEPLTEDYVTLYKENALLKSKMKFLVSKLEEYQNNEVSMKDAIVNAQKTCDMMVKEAEAKCIAMLAEANASAMENAKKSDAMISAESARVEEAKKVARERISQIQDQIRACIETLEQIRQANMPTAVVCGETPVADDAVSGQSNNTDAVADEISANLQNLVGTTEDEAPKAPPQHPASDSTTGKFTNLQFGRNYDPTHR